MILYEIIPQDLSLTHKLDSKLMDCESAIHPTPGDLILLWQNQEK